MNIIVVGMGKVGYTVAEQLSQEEHDVTIIDTDEDVINDTLQDIDVIGIIGDGATRKVLQNAGIEECDLLIALTGSDELNIYCCLLGKRLGAKSTIARVRDPEYSKDVGLLKENLGLALAINPEREAAAEIQRILRFPTARNVDFFGHGKVDLLSFVAYKNCFLTNKAIKESFSKIKTKALVCAIMRGKDVFIPTGDFVIQENDETVYGFRQDAPLNGYGYKVNSQSWNGLNVLKQEIDTQYTYFFHCIITENGWVIGQGGSQYDSDSRSIEQIAGQIVVNNDIAPDYLRRVRNILAPYDYGHFFIKAPVVRFCQRG